MDTANFSQQLSGLPALVKSLAEDHTYKLKLSPAGYLSVLRGARWNTAPKPLDAGAVQSLGEKIDAQAEKAVLGPWFFCTLRSADGLTIFGERRIDLPDEPIADEVREEILGLTRTGSTGLIAGDVAANKASMLLWLASQLGERELVFVSDVPPRQVLAPTATHVFPPANDRERRSLERLLRAHDCIFWDRISRADDLVSLTSTPGTHNRWFSMDASSAQTLGSRLRSVTSSVGRLRLDSCMFIELDDDSQSKITSLCRYEDGGWTELLSAGPALTKTLGTLGDVLSAPEPGPTPRNKKSSARRRRPSPQAGIISVKRAGGSKQKTGEETKGRKVHGLRGTSVAELAESAEIEEEELLRQSAEIDLETSVLATDERSRQLEQSSASDFDEPSEPNAAEPSPFDDFDAPLPSEPNAAEPSPSPSEDLDAPPPLKPDAADPSPAGDFDEPPPGIGLQQNSDHAATNIADGAKVDAMLAKMNEDKARAEAPQFPAVDPDELTPPVRDETTALTAVDLDRIRESADDDLSWLLRDDNLGEPEPAPTEILPRDDGNSKSSEGSDSEQT
jgi:hypothetical protein